MRIVLSLVLFIVLSLTFYFTSSYEFVNVSHDYYLINNYSFFYNLVHKIESLLSLNIINSIFIAKILLLTFIVIVFAIIFRKISSIDYYSLSITFFIIIFIAIFFIAKQNENPKIDTFNSKILNQTLYIPNLEQKEYNLKINYILLPLSFLLFLIVRRFTSSPFLVLILAPSIILSLYSIYIYKDDHLPIISDKIDINNSLIISLKKDEEKLKYHFKDNIFISNDYIFSDIVSNYNEKILEKSFFYLKYFDTNNTIKNVFSDMKTHPINKDIYIYTDKTHLYNIYSIFNLASYDIIENKESNTIINIDIITRELNSNNFYNKAITKRIYKTRQSIFNLANGKLTLNNKTVFINNAFLVDGSVKRIKYDNNSSLKTISIIVDNKYMILAHQEYLKSFFIQAFVFKNYISPLLSSVYDKDGINIIKIKNPLRKQNE